MAAIRSRISEPVAAKWEIASETLASNVIMPADVPATKAARPNFASAAGLVKHVPAY
jgi:hypothetical protein